MFFAQKHSKIFLLILFVFFSVFTGCASGKKDEASDLTAPAVSETPITIDNTGSTKLPGTGNRKGYVGKIDESIVNDVENGDPASIKRGNHHRARRRSFSASG